MNAMHKLNKTTNQLRVPTMNNNYETISEQSTKAFSKEKKKQVRIVLALDKAFWVNITPVHTTPSLRSCIWETHLTIHDIFILNQVRFSN